MRIIKQGQKPEDKLHTLTCTKCKCEFEFKQSEATQLHVSRNQKILRIACPCCNTFIAIDCD